VPGQVMAGARPDAVLCSANSCGANECLRQIAVRLFDILARLNNARFRHDPERRRRARDLVSSRVGGEPRAVPLWLGDDRAREPAAGRGPCLRSRAKILRISPRTVCTQRRRENTNGSAGARDHSSK